MRTQKRPSSLQAETFMRNLIIRFFHNETGATAIEYGLIAAGIAVAIVAAVNSVGGALNTTLGSTAGAINP